VRRQAVVAAGAALAVLAAAWMAPAPPAAGFPPERVENSIGMELVLIPAGHLLVGAPDAGGRPRALRVERPFYIGAHEVTREQYARYAGAAEPGAAERDGRPHDGAMDGEPVLPDGEPGGSPRHPAAWVSWSQAQAYAGWLSARESRRYRLPTETEWEVACRAGRATRFWWGGDAAAAGAVANLADRAFQRRYPQLVRTAPGDDGHAFAAPVGSFRPNALGLHDVIGNVWEWVQPSAGAGGGPAALALGRVAMGGSFASGPERAGCDARLRTLPGYRYATTGLRLVLETDPAPAR
jgi:formylglycine-generating enzyme required for sulfatase activity